MGLLKKAMAYRESREHYTERIRDYRARHELDLDKKLCNFYTEPRGDQSRRNRDYLAAIYAMIRTDFFSAFA